jgi:hypothetical protein
MILLVDNLCMEQLFVLQRVSKRLQNVIEGSQKLQVKIFGLLACTSQDARPSLGEDFQSSYGDGDFTRFNPLMGISRADTRLQLLLFRHFNFRLEWEYEKERTQLCLRSPHPLGGAIEKKLRPHLAGSWWKMAITKVPLTVRVQVDDQYLKRLSLTQRRRCCNGEARQHTEHLVQ